MTSIENTDCTIFEKLNQEKNNLKNHNEDICPNVAVLKQNYVDNDHEKSILATFVDSILSSDYALHSNHQHDNDLQYSRDKDIAEDPTPSMHSHLFDSQSSIMSRHASKSNPENVSSEISNIKCSDSGNQSAFSHVYKPNNKDIDINDGNQLQKDTRENVFSYHPSDEKKNERNKTKPAYKGGM